VGEESLKTVHYLLSPSNEIYTRISPQNAVLQIDDRYNSHTPTEGNKVENP
jgi:hypothetical protein